MTNGVWIRNRYHLESNQRRPTIYLKGGTITTNLIPRQLFVILFFSLEKKQIKGVNEKTF